MSSRKKLKMVASNMEVAAGFPAAPVASVVLFPLTLVVNPSVPAKSVKEFVELAKAKPGALNFGSAGSGNATHLAGELFKQMAAVDLVHIPFKGGAPALVAPMAGEVQAHVQ